MLPWRDDLVLQVLEGQNLVSISYSDPVVTFGIVPCINFLGWELDI